MLGCASTGRQPSPDHETFSLFPQNAGTERADGTTPCTQGFKYRGAADTGGIGRSGKCKRLSVTKPCVETAFNRYPIGKYCASGPNSDTFAGTIVRSCVAPMIGSGDVVDQWSVRELLDGDWVPGCKIEPARPGDVWAVAPSVGKLDVVGEAFHCPSHDCSG